MEREDEMRSTLAKATIQYDPARAEERIIAYAHLRAQARDWITKLLDEIDQLRGGVGSATTARSDSIVWDEESSDAVGLRLSLGCMTFEIFTDTCLFTMEADLPERVEKRAVVRFCERVVDAYNQVFDERR